MGNCVKCGDTLPEGAHFCPGCGVPRALALPPEPEPAEAAENLDPPAAAQARAVEEGWDGAPLPEHHHLHAAEVAKVAANTTAKTITWTLGILFTICIVCAVFAMGVLAVTSLDGGLVPGIAFGAFLVLLLVGILYALMRRAGFFAPTGPDKAPVPVHTTHPAPHPAATPHPQSAAARAVRYPLMALGMLVGAILLVVVLITYYAAVVAAVNIFGGNIIIGIVLATLLLSGIAWLLYTRLDLQGMKR